MDEVRRVTVTPAAAALIRSLREEHGALLFHQSGGCCDGSAPMCYPAGDFRLGQSDVRLGEIEGCAFYMGGAQFEYWKHTQLIIDVIDGHGGTFSLEGPEGKAFHTRSRVFSDAEWAELSAADTA
jgi:uncharacterized protein (DUF779 family)